MSCEFQSELPQGWRRCKLPDFTRIVMGQSPASETYNSSGYGLPFYQGKSDFGYLFPRIRLYCTEPNKVADPGATLLSVRAPVGPTNLAQNECSIGRGIAAIHPYGGIDPKFVLYMFRNIEPVVSREGTGSTFKAITKAFVQDLEFDLPPLSEQRRILNRLEELLSELDKGVESLKKALAQLVVFRQTVLKHAFKGKFTAQWRQEKKDRLQTPEQLLTTIREERVEHYEQRLRDWTAVAAWNEQGRCGDKPRRPKTLPTVAGLSRDVTSTLPTLADSWAWEKLAWMTCGVEYGTAAKSAMSGEVPVLRMGNIRAAKFDWSDLVYSSDDDEIGKYLLHDGDVLFNRTNSPEWVGKTAIYRGGRPAIFAGYLIRINHIRSVVDGQYLNLFLNSHIARHYGNSVKTDGVNQSNINGAKLLNYPFPYCSIEEQRKTVSILDSLLGVARQVRVPGFVQPRQGA